MSNRAKIESLQNRIVEINRQCQEISARCDEEKRDATEEERSLLERGTRDFETLKSDILRYELIDRQAEELSQPISGPRVERAPPGRSEPRADDDDHGHQELEDRRRLRREERPELTPSEPLGGSRHLGPQDGGFRSLGEFANDVRHFCIDGGAMSRRLERWQRQCLAAPTTYGSEGVGADGGVMVPPDFRNAVMQTVLAEGSLLSRCDQVTVDGNSFVCPMDETTPWQTTGGIQANWDGEAQAAQQSKPQLGERTVKLNKLRVLVPMTEELLEDASATDSYLRRKAPAKIAFKVNLALIQGTGVGQPLGLLNSPALVTVAKESGQQSNTIVANNVFKMYNRMYSESRPTAAWFYNQEVEPQLFKLAVPGTDNTGNAVTGWGGLVYMPPGGISAAPYGSLMGRPCIPTQACPALSSVGDIIFADMGQYLALLKSGPNPRVDISMHLWFDQDLTAYKFTLRIGGVPWWSTPAAALAGSNTYSPYVALQAR